jgi:hypothetical protein
VVEFPWKHPGFIWKEHGAFILARDADEQRVRDKNRNQKYMKRTAGRELRTEKERNMY